jgi:hypothetical protein
VNKLTILSGIALLALTTAATAGPTSIAREEVLSPQSPIEHVHWRRVCHVGWHSGWYRPRHYGYYGAHYAYSPPAIGGQNMASEGYYCATDMKTCLLREPGWTGTGCSCRVPGGQARGLVE